jgi:iron complex transport system substrate-binding protein
VFGCDADRTIERGPASSPEAPGFVVDSRDRRLSTSAPRARVVSLVPALTDIILALGAAHQIVGRTRFDTDVRLEPVPSVGGTVDANVEAILDAAPDLVITWADVDVRSLTETLESFGVSVYAARSHAVADFERHTRALGALLGRGAEADSLIRKVDAGLDSVRHVVPDSVRPSVLFVIWSRPLVTTGSGTFVDELIRLVGARGVFDDLDEPWPTVSIEVVFERDPDLIVIASEDTHGAVPSWIGRHPLWGRLSAVREGRVHLVDGDLFNRPGPRMDVAAGQLAGFVRALEEGRR